MKQTMLYINKKQYYYFRLYTGIWMICIFLFQSCIDEDNSSCTLSTNQASVDIYFRNDSTVNEFKKTDLSDVKSISLFVFDENGFFRSLYKDDNVVFDNEFYKMKVGLEPGMYTFISWINLSEPYFTIPSRFESNVTNVDSAFLYLKRATDDTIRTKLPLLMFGNLRQIEVKPVIDQAYDIQLKQNTNRIHIQVKGLPQNDNMYQFIITDNNGKYTFDNSFTTDSYLHYTQLARFNSVNELSTSLTVLRLDYDRQPELKIFNQTQGELIYKTNLVELINILISEQPHSVGWNKTHTFNIILTFDIDNSNVTISINGWVVIENEWEIS